MFTLDALNDDGSAAWTYFLPDTPSEPWRAQHMTTARSRAIQCAAMDGHRVGIKARDRYVLIVSPDGSLTAPPGMKVDPRNVHVEGRACFCTACRAKREDERHA